MADHGHFRMACVPCGFEAIPTQSPFLRATAQAACPRCGQSQFKAEVLLHEEPLVVRDATAFKAHGPRGGKARAVLASGKVGSSIFGLTGRWHRLQRRIDHVADTYDEVIVDEEAGEVVREVHEPLSQHQGRGSARRRPEAGK